MIKGPIPPEVWLRERIWGRDVVHFANDEEDRLEVGDLLEWADMEVDLQSIIMMNLINNNDKSQSLVKNADKLSVYRRLGGDPMMAQGLASYVFDGRCSYAIGSRAQREILAGEAPKMSELTIPNSKAFYVSFEESMGVTGEGGKLHGFLCSPQGVFEMAEYGIIPELHIYPMTIDPTDETRFNIFPLIRLVLAAEMTVEQVISCWRSSYDAALKVLERTWGREDIKHQDFGEKFFSPNGTVGELKKSVITSQRKVLDEIRAQADEIENNMTQHAGEWAKLIAGALNIIHEENHCGKTVYPEGADPSLVAKAMAKATGHRKAEQKLISQGFRPVIVYEKDEQGDWIDDAKPVVEAVDKTIPAHEAKDISETGDQKTDTNAKTNRRKLKRKMRQKDSPVEKSAPAASELSDPANAAAPIDKAPKPEEIILEPDPSGTMAEDAFDKVQTGATVKSDADELLRRSLRDAPAAGSKNWKLAMASAFASVITRRVRIVTTPRETIDAAKRRIAANIEERICSLDESQQRYEISSQAGIDAYRISGISTLRPIDKDIPPQDEPPKLIIVEDHDDLASYVAFPGVEPGRGHEHAGACRTLLRIQRIEDNLHIEGFAYEGCLIGYRYVILDLDNGTVDDHDSQSDIDNAEEFADIAYAALCDAVLGPVDLSDQWEWEANYELYRQKNASDDDHEQGDSHSATLIDQEPPKEIAEERVKPPASTTFHSWKNLVHEHPEPDIGQIEVKLFEELCADNSVAQAMAAVLVDNIHTHSDTMRAWQRYACSIVNSDEKSLVAIETPKIRDDIDLRSLVNLEGVIVLKDPAFLENVTDNLIDGKPAKSKAFCILYRIHLEGMSALVLQTDAHNKLSFMSWINAPLQSGEADDDLAWYLRGTIWEAMRTDAETSSTQTSILPAMSSTNAKIPTGKRQGPKRIIAQMRLRPTSMAIALEAVIEWFNEQVGRHGANLVSDKRQQGDWTIEHLSQDRGIESLWSVSVLTPQSDPNAIDIVIQTTLATGVNPRLPTLIRRIAARTPTYGPDGLLRLRPEYIKTKGEVLDLIRDLQSPERTLPILVMTQDDTGNYMRNPVEVAEQSLGAITVKTLTQNMTYELTDRLGQEYRTFGGAVRIFQPGFDPDADTATRHPRIMPDTMADKALASLINRATSATITRYDIEEVLKPVQVQHQTPVTLAAVPEAVPDKDEDYKNESTLEENKRASVREETPEETRATPEPPEDVIAKGVDIQDRIAKPESASEPETQSKPDRGDESKTAPISQDKKAEPTQSSPAVDQAKPDATEAQLSAPEQAKPQLVDIERFADVVTRIIDERLAGLGLDALRSDVGKITEMLSKAPAPVATESEKDLEIQALREEIRTERESTNQLLDEADAERRSAVMQVETLRQALNDKRRSAHGQDKKAYPDDLSGLGDWLDNNVLPNVVISTKAWRNMRNVPYRDMERLCETLKLLDGAYIDMRAGEDGARKKWQEGLQTLRLEDKKQTKLGRAARESDYQFTHEGETWLVERHLRGNESVFNDHSKLLRIYYSYDADRARVLIGHLPTHLHTKDS